MGPTPSKLKLFINKIRQFLSSLPKRVKYYFWEFDYHTGATIFRPKRLFGVFSAILLSAALIYSVFIFSGFIKKETANLVTVDQKDITVIDKSDENIQSLDNKTPEEGVGNGGTSSATSNSTPNDSKDTTSSPDSAKEDATDDSDEELDPDTGTPTPEPPSVNPPKPPEPIKPIRIVAVGDIACDPLDTARFNYGNGTDTNCRLKQLGDLIRRLKPNAVLLLGDLQYPYSSIDRLKLSYDTYWKDILSLSYTIPGNHDYLNYSNKSQKNIEDSYFEYFGANTSPQNKLALTKKDSEGRKKGYYSFDLSAGDIKWHLVALNTNNLCKNVPCSAASIQGQWLKNNLQNNSATKCSIAYAHYPPTNTASKGESTDAIEANRIGNVLFNNQLSGKVDIALFGHAHHYERLARVNGTRPFVVGLGGKGFTKSPENSADIVGKYFYRGRAGVLQLDLYKNSYTWSLINEDKKVKDSGTDTCY